jgi:hypothetical protein
MKNGYIDFTDLKAKISIEQVLSMLGIELKSQGDQLRGRCPIHQGGNDRQFVVTPAKGVWYCFGDCASGGDMIELVAKARSVSVKQAAQEIAEHFRINGQRPAASEPSGRLTPLDYLQTDHPALAPLGLRPETLAAFGAGYAPKGIMRGKLAIPIHALDGTLLAYCGRNLDEHEPGLAYPKGFDPNTVILNAHQMGPGTLYAVRDPLALLKAHQNGIGNVIAFLHEITPPLLEMLATIMRERGATSVELH